jgi:AraC family transcriptional regulator
MTEAYGQRLGPALRVENAPAIVSRALRTADIAVTEIRCDNPLPEMSGSIQHEDAFLVGLHFRDVPAYKYWEDGRQAPVYDLRAGESFFYDLKRDPRGLLHKPYHTLAFYLPRAALDAITDDANAPRIRDLKYEPGAGVNDVTISSLGRLLLPALRAIPTKLTRCFSTTSCRRSGCMWRIPMEACGQYRRPPGVDSRHGSSDARGNFFSPTSRTV